MSYRQVNPSAKEISRKVEMKHQSNKRKCRHLRRLFYLHSPESIINPPLWECGLCGHSVTNERPHENISSLCACPSHSQSAISLEETPGNTEESLQLHCNRCGVFITVPRDHPQCRGHLTAGQFGRSKTKFLVQNINELQPGDHIFFRRPAYDHHAIVTLVNYADGEFNMIHYTADGGLAHLSSATSSALFASPWNQDQVPTVVESESVSLDEQRGILYKVVYLPLDCLPVYEVVQHARNRLGETSYSLLRRNCEHFALECKVGTDQVGSHQVSHLMDSVRQGFHRTVSSPGNLAAARLSPLTRGALLMSSLNSFMGDMQTANQHLEEGDIGNADYMRQLLRSGLSNGMRATSVFLPSVFSTTMIFGANIVEHYLSDQSSSQTERTSS